MTYLHLFAPAIIGWLFGNICPMTDNTNRVKTNSQPPGWVFGVVWPILYLLIGWNWMKTKSNPTLNILHILLVIALNGWVYKAGCQTDYRTGAWIFIPIIGLTLAIWMKSAIVFNNGWWTMIPLLSWLLFAHQLNVHIVEKS